MVLKEIPKEELQSMGYDEIAYLILEEAGKKMKLLDLFKKVCKALELPESVIEDRIGDFFELLSINKKFVLLKNGYWDLSTKHVQSIIVEDEEDSISDEIGGEELEENYDEEIESEEDEDIFYDNDIEDDNDEDDDLKDLVIMEDEENPQE